MAAEAGKKAAALRAANLIHPDAAKWLGEFWDKPQAYLKTHARAANHRPGTGRARVDPVGSEGLPSPVDTRMAAALLASDWEGEAARDLVSWVWASIGKHGGLRRLPEPGSGSRKQPGRARDRLVGRHLGLEGPAWPCGPMSRRCAGCGAAGAGRHERSRAASPHGCTGAPEAYLASGRTSRQADAQRLLEAIATPQTFYGKLALEELGRGLACGPVSQHSADQRRAFEGAPA